MGDVRVISTADILCGFRAFRHNSAFSDTEVGALSKISGFTWIPWQTFSNLAVRPLSHWSVIEVFTRADRQKSEELKSGDRVGQLTGPPRPIRCSPQVSFSCSLSLRRKLMHKPHVLWWWVGACYKSTCKAFTKKWWYPSLLRLLGETVGPKRWSPKMPTQTQTRPYLSTHWFLKIRWLEFCCSFMRVPYHLETDSTLLTLCKVAKTLKGE
jgi:hypothetical protein